MDGKLTKMFPFRKQFTRLHQHCPAQTAILSYLKQSLTLFSLFRHIHFYCGLCSCVSTSVYAPTTLANCLSPERHSMMDLAKLKYTSQLQECAGLPTCVQVIVPAVDGCFSYHATNPARRGQRNQEGQKI